MRTACEQKSVYVCAELCVSLWEVLEDADDTYGYVGIAGDSMERGNEACNHFSASRYPQVLREGMHKRVQEGFSPKP